jgi:hypothetical protein
VNRSARKLFRVRAQVEKGFTWGTVSRSISARLIGAKVDDKGRTVAAITSSPSLRHAGDTHLHDQRLTHRTDLPDGQISSGAPGEGGGLAASFRWKNCLRVKTHFASRFKAIRAFNPSDQIFRFIRSNNCACIAPSRAHQRGGRVVTNAGRGMGWTVQLQQTSVVAADGEVVWSWRPDAGVKLSWSKLHEGDGGKRARSPGRARSKP